MASVFALLLDTLPFVMGVRNAMQAASTSDLATLPVTRLHAAIQPLAKTADHHPPAPGLPSDPDAAFVRHRLWSYRHTASSPAQLTRVTCRVRETGYKTQVAADHIDFGYNEDGEALRNIVKVIRPGESGGADTTLELPLTQDYVHSKWKISQGYLGAGSNAWYPLQATLDRGLVIAFAYELGPNGLVPYAPPADDEGEVALAQYLGGVDACTDAEGDRWIARASRGGFMPAGEGANARAAVGETTRVSATYPRFLVVLSISLMKERPDFEPGGIVGMARLYPHIMVTASVPLRSIHAAVKITRPRTTTALDAGDGTRVGSCCNSHEVIKSILVADSNGDMTGPDLAGFPFWSGLFSYIEIDPVERLPDHILRVVRRDKPTERTVEACGVRDIPDWPIDTTDIRKMPRQGEFDNIHVAPRLRLPATELIQVTSGAPHYPIDATQMRLDPIVMAPFCAHDCFHMHWRWGTSPNMVMSAYRWSLGWGDSAWSPHTEDGKPLTPPNHDVDLIVHAAATFTHREHAYPTKTPGDDATHTIAANTWRIFAYPGTAYAQGLFEWRSEVTSPAQFGDSIMSGVMTQLHAGVSFTDASGTLMNTTNTPAALYWSLRYYPEQNAAGEWVAREWLQMTEAERDRARWY